MPEEDPDLEQAYALRTPEDSVRLYRGWADTYDREFALAKTYRLPGLVASRLIERHRGAGPVLDVGAGTGLVAEALPRDRPFSLDGLDISPDMLAVAGKKGLYRQTLVADLTQTLPIPDSSYDAIVSAGTFTHGHVGPDAVDELLRIARPGALFALSVNASHFEALGFADKFRSLAETIKAFEMPLVPIYGAGADPEHAEDQAHIVTFRKG